MLRQKHEYRDRRLNRTWLIYYVKPATIHADKQLAVYNQFKEGIYEELF